MGNFELEFMRIAWNKLCWFGEIEIGLRSNNILLETNATTQIFNIL